MSPAGSFRYAIAIQLVEPGVRIRLQHTAEASKMSLRMDAFLSGCERTSLQVPTLTPALRSSRTYAHNRPVFILSTRQQYLDRGIIGMEFAVSHDIAMKRLFQRRQQPAACIHPARQQCRHLSSTPCRPYISDWRYGRGCALHTSRSAPGPAAPVRRYPAGSAADEGAGACTIVALSTGMFSVPSG